MSSQAETSATYVFVNNAAHGLSDTNAESSLAAGSGCFFITGTGAEIDTAITSNAAYCYYAYKTAGGTIIKSPRFKGTSIKNAVFGDKLTAVQQISYLGYNSSTGSFDATAGYYALAVRLNHTFGLLNNSPLIKTVPYKSSTASQSDISRGLVLAADKAFSRDPHRAIVFEAICNEAVTTANCFDNNATVVQGATTFTVGTNLQYNSGAGTAAVGDFVRLGTAAGAVGATALGSAVYKITAISSLTVTVDRPIRVASGTYTAAGNMAEVLTAAEGAAANWGIKMTGQANTSFDPVTQTPYVVDFKVTLSDNFSTASMTYTTASKIGVGTYQLVAFDEAYSQLLNRDRVSSAYPVRPGLTFAAGSSSEYNVIEFEVSDQEYSSVTTGINPKSSYKIKIYLLDSTCDTDYGNFKTVVGSTAITTS